MKMQIPFRAFILAAGATAMVAMSGCKQGPVNYDNFEQRTIKANLAAIDSAQVLYHAQLAAGNIDAAAQQACQFLLAQPGVNTAEIAPDSTVWAHFTSGLLAGTGDIERPTTGPTNAGRQAPNREPVVRAASGGEVFNVASYLLPFPDELPGTVDASAALMGIFDTKLNWKSESVSMGHQVDLEKVLNLIKNGRSVIVWSGHGTLVAPDSGDSACTPGLVLGKSYGNDDAASAAAVQYADYLNPGEGQERQAAMVKFENDPAWYLVILPGFIRAHGYFDGTEAMPGYPFCKTVVMLSTCYSAYSPAGAPGDMIQAFRSVGADVVCGYTWAVHDNFACNKDTAFLAAMADTCLAGEALTTIGSRVDPNPIKGHQAVFTMVGDSMVMLQAMLQARKDGELYQTCSGGTVDYQSDGTQVLSMLHTQGSFDPVDYVNVTFPGNSAGTFDVMTTDNAMIVWEHSGDPDNWYAEKGMRGVSGTIQIDSCDGGNVFGSFSGTVGQWTNGHDPATDPPDNVLNITEGRIKHTGK